jgi:peptide deformylase
MPVDLSTLRVQIYPAPILRQKVSPVPKITDEVKAVAARMIELMRESKGIGLAAPQVGLPWRMFVVEIDADNKRVKTNGTAPGSAAAPATSTQGPVVYINPRLTSPAPTVEPGEEGCLSLPNVYGDVLRPPTITITATDLTGKEFTTTGTGLLARCWQHEFDHLDGVLIIDKMIAAHRTRNRMAIQALIVEESL